MAIVKEYPPLSLVTAKTSTESLISVGRMYTLVHEFSLGQGATEYIALRTDSSIISAWSLSLGTTAIQTKVELLEDTVWTDFTGTTATSFNRNRNFRLVPFPIDNAEINPTITDEGLIVEAFTMYGQTGSGSTREVFSAGGISTPYVLEPSNGYLVKITNEDTDTRFFRSVLYLAHGEELVDAV